MVSMPELISCNKNIKKNVFNIKKRFFKESFEIFSKLYMENSNHAGTDFLQQKYKKKHF
jgi:hypothetical protein